MEEAAFGSAGCLKVCEHWFGDCGGWACWVVVNVVANDFDRTNNRDVGKLEIASDETNMPGGRMARTTCRKSSVEFIMCLAGRYSVMMVFSCFAMV